MSRTDNGDYVRGLIRENDRLAAYITDLEAALATERRVSEWLAQRLSLDYAPRTFPLNFRLNDQGESNVTRWLQAAREAVEK